MSRKIKEKTGIIWTTKEGKEIDISDMTYTHLSNTINFLEKKVKEFKSIPYPNFRTELAQEVAEIEYEDCEEHFSECIWMIDCMKKEQERRLYS